jgi:large subunit ribosomal protein L7/L12
MKLIKQVAAGIFLAFGFVFLLAALSGVMSKEKDRGDLILGGLVLGVPPTAFAIWLLRGTRGQQAKSENDRLQAAFYKLLKQNNGRITPLDLAIETGISGELTRTYLDERAREFVANFDVDATGNIFYLFSLSGTGQTQAIAASASTSSYAVGNTFDVILEAVPDRNKIGAIKVVRQLTNLGLADAKSLVESVPTPVQSGVTEAVAQAAKRDLEAIGATVMIMAR